VVVREVTFKDYVWYFSIEQLRNRSRSCALRYARIALGCQADATLYLAKISGRNCVIVHNFDINLTSG
jgi:hypothetical protein